MLTLTIVVICISLSSGFKSSEFQKLPISQMFSANRDRRDINEYLPGFSDPDKYLTFGELIPECFNSSGIYDEYFQDFPSIIGIVDYPKYHRLVSPEDFTRLVEDAIEMNNLLDNPRLSARELMEQMIRLILNAKKNCISSVYTRFIAYVLKAMLKIEMFLGENSLNRQLIKDLNQPPGSEYQVERLIDNIIWNIYSFFRDDLFADFAYSSSYASHIELYPLIRQFRKDFRDSTDLKADLLQTVVDHLDRHGNLLTCVCPSDLKKMQYNGIRYMESGFLQDDLSKILDMVSEILKDYHISTDVFDDVEKTITIFANRTSTIIKAYLQAVDNGDLEDMSDILGPYLSDEQLADVLTLLQKMKWMKPSNVTIYPPNPNNPTECKDIVEELVETLNRDIDSLTRIRKYAYRVNETDQLTEMKHFIKSELAARREKLSLYEKTPVTPTAASD